MNISEMHTRVKQWNNTVLAPRFPAEQIDNALNTAINTTVDDIYDPEDIKDKDKAFQAYQRARDQLYTLIEIEPSLAASSSDSIPVYTLPGYRYLLELSVTISGSVYPTYPTTYDEESVRLQQDPFSKPTLEYPPVLYRIEKKDGVKIIWDNTGTLQTAKVVYLKNPAVVNLGTLVNCDLPTVLHEQVCKLASAILLDQIKNLVKA